MITNLHPYDKREKGLLQGRTENYCRDRATAKLKVITLLDKNIRQRLINHSVNRLGWVLDVKVTSEHIEIIGSSRTIWFRKNNKFQVATISLLRTWKVTK